MRLLRHINMHRRTFSPDFGTVELRAFVSLNPSPPALLLPPALSAMRLPLLSAEMAITSLQQQWRAP